MGRFMGLDEWMGWKKDLHSIKTQSIRAWLACARSLCVIDLLWVTKPISSEKNEDSFLSFISCEKYWSRESVLSEHSNFYNINISSSRRVGFSKILHFLINVKNINFLLFWGGFSFFWGWMNSYRHTNNISMSFNVIPKLVMLMCHPLTKALHTYIYMTTLDDRHYWMKNQKYHIFYH